MRFPAKLLPQDPENNYQPRDGLQLVNPDVQYDPIGAAEFRIEKLDLDRGFLGLQKYFKSLEGSEKMSVVNSWDR